MSIPHKRETTNNTEWVIRNQFGRRNITSYVRAELALRLENIIKARAKENQIRKPVNSVLRNSVEQIEPISTQKELAKIAGVSHDTIHKKL